MLIVTFAGLLIVLNLVPWAPAHGETNPLRVASGEKPHIVPHGGAKLMFPENTIYSYRNIYERGWDTFEIDLCLTADGLLVTHHDVTIASTTGVQGVRVRDLTYEELTQLNFAANFTALDGSQPFANTDSLSAEQRAELVPATLDYLFNLYPDNFYILELKDTLESSGQETADAAVNELIRLIESHGMKEQVVVASFGDDVIREFREKSDETILTGAATNETLMLSVFSGVGLDFFLKAPYQSVMLPVKDPITGSTRSTVEALPGFLRNALAVYDRASDTYFTNLANQRMVDDAHRKNIAVYYWTVNDEQTMSELIDMGVDGIITDRPDLLENVLQNK